MPRIRQDNDARYALRASFVDQNGEVLEGDTIVINTGGTDDSRITDGDISNWNTAYGWGDHAAVGYLTDNAGGFSDTYSIPIITGDVAYTGGSVQIVGSTGQINTPNHGNSSLWNTAYGWGDHAAAGYGTSSFSGSYDDLTNKPTIPTNNNQLTNGAGYITNSGGIETATASTVVRRDDKRDISARLLKSDFNNQSTISGGIAYRVNNGVDNYVRFCSSGSAIRAFIGAGTSSFSGSYNDLTNKPTIPTNNNQLTNGAGYVTAAGSVAYATTAGAANTVNGSWGNTSNSWYNLVWQSGNNLYSTNSVRIQASGGYVQATYLNMTHGQATSNSHTVFYSSSDEYIRKNTAAGFRASLDVPTRTGGSASGTWGISITGNAASASSVAWSNVSSKPTLLGAINYNNNTASTYQMLWGSGNAVYGTAGITCNPSTNVITASAYYASAWYYSTGATGWYNSSYGGGMYMTDSTWVRVYNGKQFYVSNTSANAIATPGDVVAGYSDIRLKDVEGFVEGALEKISTLDGIYYRDNAKAREMGYRGSERKVGLIAQQVQEVLPEVIKRAPVDMDADGGSLSGEDYITVDYQRVVPLLVEGIKELTEELQSVKLQLKEMRNGSPR